MTDISPSPEPSKLEVGDAFGEDVAVAFEQIMEKQKMSHFDEMRTAIDARYRGRTITRAEADELIGMINRCVPPEPEVPEAVKDLLDDGSYISDFGAELDRRVLEAFRRGQNSGTTEWDSEQAGKRTT